MRIDRVMATGAALVAAVLLTASCGSSSTGSPAAIAVETEHVDGVDNGPSLLPACDLVDPTALAPILGAEYQQDGVFTVTTKDNSQGSISSCDVSWGAVNWTPKHFLVEVLHTDNLQYTSPIGEKRNIPGIGDEAFEAGDNWFARRGSVVVHVVNVQETDDVADRVLADTVSRLPSQG